MWRIKNQELMVMSRKAARDVCGSHMRTSDFATPTSTSSLSPLRSAALEAAGLSLRTLDTMHHTAPQWPAQISSEAAQKFAASAARPQSPQSPAKQQKLPPFVVSTDETLCSCSGSDLLSAMAVARSEEGIDEGSDEGRMVERKEGDG